MPYDQIVFIGYVIDTAPEVDPTTGNETYLGLPDAGQDIAARCQLMQAAMEQARTMVPPPASPPLKTLYVFMAPEFFFRGDTGAYQMDDVQSAIVQLQTIAADAQWDDWVFEFGTIVGCYEDPGATTTTQACNFALVQQGGAAAQGADGARAIVKELKSDIDFIATDANPGGLLLGAVTHAPADAPSPGAERQKAAYDGAGIFTLNGPDLADINWAVEICLDHLEGRLLNSPQLPHEALVQVQLVPSCGADADEDNVVAQPDGYVFNVDGYRGQAHAALYQAGPPLTRLPCAATAPVDVADVTIGSPPQTVPVTDLYAGGAGSISVYEPVAVPPTQTVPGSRVTEGPWAASEKPDWSFTFDLIYDDQNDFSSALCQIRSGAINFYGNKYELPLSLTPTFPPTPTDPVERTGTIDIYMGPGGGGYDCSIFGEIDVPGYSFVGEIIQIKTSKDALDSTKTVW